MLKRYYFLNLYSSHSLIGCTEVNSTEFEKAIIRNNNDFISIRHKRDWFDVIFYYNSASNLIGYIKEFCI